MTQIIKIALINQSSIKKSSFACEGFNLRFKSKTFLLGFDFKI